MFNFLICPRCDAQTYERLKTHAYCFECNYSPEFLWEEDYAVPKVLLKYMEDTKKQKCGRKPKSASVVAIPVTTQQTIRLAV